MELGYWKEVGKGESVKMLKGMKVEEELGCWGGEVGCKKDTDEEGALGVVTM